MATVVGEVSQVVGTVIAIDESGNERVLNVGDQVFAGETLKTGDGAYVAVNLIDGGRLDLGRNGEAVLDGDVVSLEPAGQEPPAADQAALSVESIQAAIAAGVDPTQLLPATAAGPGAGPGAGGGPDGAGHSFVIVPPGLTESLPGVPEFVTQGFGVNFGELPGTEEGEPLTPTTSPTTVTTSPTTVTTSPTTVTTSPTTVTTSPTTVTTSPTTVTTSPTTVTTSPTTVTTTPTTVTTSPTTVTSPTTPTSPTLPDGQAISNVNFYIMVDGKLTVVKIEADLGNDYTNPQNLETALEGEYLGDLVGYSVKTANNLYHYLETEDGWRPVAYETHENDKGTDVDTYYLWDNEEGWVTVDTFDEYKAAVDALYPAGATPYDWTDSNDTIQLSQLNVLSFSSLFESDSLFGESTANGSGGNGDGGGQPNPPDVDNLLGGGGGEDA